ncbi:BHLH domain-containing protein [Mycena venus]|uniref:BHLH domain-containing protein n=1 Tax=Mycena venus TaxID=2733690 RepID=A0A8H6YX44_9AGAR|nr:BHLH domain-containing protein [Mycena venus]
MDWTSQPWYEDICEFLRLLRSPRSAELLPNASTYACNKFEDIMPTVHHDVEVEVTNIIGDSQTENAGKQSTNHLDALEDLHCEKNSTTSVHSQKSAPSTNSHREDGGDVQSHISSVDSLDVAGQSVGGFSFTSEESLGQLDDAQLHDAHDMQEFEPGPDTGQEDMHSEGNSTTSLRRQSSSQASAPSTNSHPEDDIDSWSQLSRTDSLDVTSQNERDIIEEDNNPPENFETEPELEAELRHMPAAINLNGQLLHDPNGSPGPLSTAIERQRRETFDGRLLSLAALLSNLENVRRPTTSEIIDSSIAHLNASRRHRILAAQQLQMMKNEADAIRHEANQWRARAGVLMLEEPIRREAFGIVVRAGELEFEAGDMLEGDSDGDEEHDAPYGTPQYTTDATLAAFDNLVMAVETVERQRRETLNRRFRNLAALLPNLTQIHRPSKLAIVNSSIACLNASRQHRILAAQQLRMLKNEADAIRREANEWRARAGVPIIEEPMRAEALGIVLRGELEFEAVDVLEGDSREDEEHDGPYGAPLWPQYSAEPVDEYALQCSIKHFDTPSGPSFRSI